MEGIREKSDERILGSGEFVQQLIQNADEERKKQFTGRTNLEIAIDYIMSECKNSEIDIKALKAGSRRRKISEVRARLIEKLVDEFGLSLAEVGRQLGVSSSAVSKALRRRNTKKG